MKIGIITFSAAHNYGAQVQAYALQTYLTAKGHDVKIINYRICEIAKSYRLIKHRKRKNPIKNYVVWAMEIASLCLKNSFKFAKKNAFENFINQDLNVTDKYFTLEELRDADLDFDVLISGSDQVWNYKLTKGIKPAFFLDFGREDATRLSYAASLGVEEIPEDYKESYQLYLKKLDFISVREESAKEIISPLTKSEVEVVLDPTFLLKKKDYEQISIKPKYKQPYIYMHMLIEDENLIRLVKRASEKLGLPVVHNKPEKIFKNELDHAITTGPKEFLGLIQNAEYVFTNSFHATALSIINHTQFLTVPHKKYPTRMQNLLDKLQLSSNLIPQYDKSIDIRELKVDFETVDKKLDDLRDKSMAYLDKAIVKKSQKESSFFEENDKFSCYGCTACKEVCPTKAITMETDSEGFIYPVIDDTKCIHCDLCKKICIYSKKQLLNSEANQEVYALKAKDEKVRFNSTSGGAFTALYTTVIANGGYVAGVKMNSKRAVYDIASDIAGCEEFRGAKYVRADVGNIYSRVKELLDNEKTVLFSGTPCVVAGLKSFLRKDYSNLILVDIVCHSNSSPKVLEEYLEHQEKLFGSTVKDVKFRVKTPAWRDSKFKIDFADNQTLLQSVYNNNYTANFLLGNNSRPVCYNCEFATYKRPSDITLGDYWGINKNYKFMDDKKGTSLVMVNTEKGKELFKKSIEGYDVAKTNHDDALISNHKSPILLKNTRSAFFEEYNNAESKIDVLEKYNKRKMPFIEIGNILPSFKYKNNENIISSMCLYKMQDDRIALRDTYFRVGDFTFKSKFLFKKGIPLILGYRLNFYRVRLDILKLLKNDIQNKLLICAMRDKAELSTGVGYDLLGGKGRNSEIWTIPETNTAWYFRQSAKNAVYLTIREGNKTDNKKSQFKINLAKLLSKLCFKEDIIIMFEKEASKYEESASVLYEKLIDLGYKNCYFVFDQEFKKMYHIPKKYRSNILKKGSLKHYIYFFKSNKFIGTESMAHAIDLRIANKNAAKKLRSKNVSYVFLQHGVMYMVSLNADMRKHFNKEDKKLYKVVVSSQLEANHFIELGGYDRDNIYLTGLPKYDRNTWNEDADKIVIMPTWRRWEYNTIRDDVESSNYFKMIQRIIDCIPDELKEKLIVLPHPLFKNIVKLKEFELKKYIPEDIIYDDILKQTKLLITDYSSISYDAFYRGTNVIFYWEEKDFCMSKYGESAKLMLTEDLAFGDVFYNTDGLRESIIKNYNSSQRKEHLDNYKKIVEFHDSQNTQRVIDNLIKDKVIKRLV